MIRLIELQHGDVLIRERQRLEHFFIVKSGALVAFRSDRTLLNFGRADVVGLETALERHDAPYSVLAIGKVEVLEIPVDDFSASGKHAPPELRLLAEHFLNQSEQTLRLTR